jgi:predicted permease
MRLIRIVRQRFRSIFRSSQVENDLDRELALHLDQLAREYRAGGMCERDARNAAIRSFGGVAFTAEQCRDTRRVSLLEDLSKDLAYALRLLRKSPVFTATATLSLALGIGANTAIFGLVKQVILDLLPVRNPDQIVALSRTSSQRPEPSNSFSNPFLRDLQASANPLFEGFLAFDELGRVAMLTESGAEPVSAEFVTGNYFDLLGVSPAMGRLFSAADDETAGAHPVAVLSHQFWKRRFGADPSVLNRTIRLNNFPFTIIGVSARGFDGLNPGRSPDVRVTISMATALVQFPGPSTLTNRGSRWLRIFGRLKPGMSLERAAESLTPVLLQDHDQDAGRSKQTEYWKKVVASERLQVTPAAQGTAAQRRDYGRAIWVLTGIVAAVLLLTCVNLAHLLLARASVRTHEFGIRLAIGAGRMRIVRQLLTESLVLGLSGGAAGVLVAYGLGRILATLVIFDPNHSTVSLAPDSTLLAFHFAIALAASIGFGLAPAVQSSRSGVGFGLKGGHAGNVNRLTGRKVMISLQVAISLVLLAGASLFIRSLINLRTIEVGFRTDRILQVTLNPSDYPPESLPAFYNQIIEQVRSIPGVHGATYGRQRMVSGNAWNSGIVVPGFTPVEDRAPYRDAIGDRYFSTMGIPLMAGREFTAADTAMAPKVAIINQAFARFYFGDQNPLGKLIGPGGSKAEYSIVGVTRNAKYRDMREASTPFWYVPFSQLSEKSAFRALTLFVRTSADPDSMTNRVREAVARVDKSMALFDVKTVDAQLADNLRIEKLLAILSMFFGMVAALLAGAGLFGVLAYSVAQRRREIGIRIAVGARPVQAAWTVVRGVGGFVLVGVAAGIFAAAALSSIIRRLLFGIQPDDPFTLAVAAAGVGAIAVVAAILPASQAANVEPASALRSD